MMSSTTGLIGDYLYDQRISQDSINVEKMATAMAPLVQSVRSDSLLDEISEMSGEAGGRILVIDNDAKVQYDSFNLLSGCRLQTPEVLAVLTGGRSSASGIRSIADGELMAEGETRWVAYYTAAMIGTRGPLGALMLVTPVDEMISSLESVQRRMVLFFVLVASAALIMSLLFSQIITKPISEMTRTIRKMGEGDLSARVEIRSTGEMRTLAENYNAMAEQLESLDKSRNQFVSNASHELRTPLTTMKLMLENMIYQPDMPQDMRMEFMSDMNHEIDRLTGIVTDLLTLTRMDNRHESLKIENFNLSELAGETLRMLMPAAEQRDQQLSGKIAPKVFLMGDRTKLGQIIYNLTENAIKYTADGGEITLSVEKEGRDAVIRVCDNGIGISEEDQKRIFERFYRVDKARSRESGGTGLGLSIVRQYIKLHNGTISVESKPGEGSRFTVWIPVDRDEEEEV